METQTIKQFSDLREQRANAILEHAKPECLDENTYLVPSQFDSTKKYQVTHFDSYSCECEDFKRRCQGKGLFCKHIKAILIFERLKNAYELEQIPIKKEIGLIIDKPQEELCPFCSSENLVKSGIRKTKIGEKQRYECRDCKKRFVLSPIPRIKGNAKIVCLAMDCYYKGLSYRDIADQFKQFYGLSISHEAVRGWVLKFSKILDNYSKTIPVNSKGNWNADETMVLTKRGIDNKNPNKEYDYVWNVMNSETKFLLASVNSGRGRSSKDAQKVMGEAWEQNNKMPNKIITDKLGAYQDGIRKTFRNWGNERKVKHASILGHRHEINNNIIEGHHSLQKEFQKVRRGLTEVQTYADGFRTFHNFVRKGVSDKLTPAERNGIGVNGNRWETMLLNSIKLNNSRNLTGEEIIAKTP